MVVRAGVVVRDRLGSGGAPFVLIDRVVGRRALLVLALRAGRGGGGFVFFALGVVGQRAVVADRLVVFLHRRRSRRRAVYPRAMIVLHAVRFVDFSLFVCSGRGRFGKSHVGSKGHQSHHHQGRKDRFSFFHRYFLLVKELD